MTRVRKTSRNTGSKAKYQLRLYVAGQTSRSQTALANLQRICETHLPGQYEIELIDLLEQPKLAAGDQILAVPTLVRKLPEPIKRSSATSRTKSACWWDWISFPWRNLTIRFEEP